MALRLLDFVAGSDGNYYFNNFGEALVYALIGFLIVFLGIALIIFIIWILGLVLRKTNNFAFLHGLTKKIFSKKKKAEQVAEVTENSEEEDIPDEVKAAIIAAVMAYCSQEMPKCEFKVKRIRRI